MNTNGSPPGARLELTRPRNRRARRGGDRGVRSDGQQLGKPAEIVAAILAFAVLGKTTDWIVALAAAPFLRWEDRFARSEES